MSQADFDRSTDVNLGAYVAGLRRQRWLIAALTVLGVVAGFAYSRARVITYASKATVAVSFEGLDRSSLPGVMATEKVVAQSTAVAEIARENLGSSDDPETLLSHLSIQGVGDAQILSFIYSDSNPEEARDGSQAFADAYVALKGKQALQSYQELEQIIQAKIDELTPRIRELSGQIATLPRTSGKRGELIALRGSLTDQMGELRGRLVSSIPLDINGTHVIEGADLPSAAENPSPIVDLVLGGLWGLFVGAVLAPLRNRRGQRWRGAVDLEESMGAPVLGLIPKTPERLQVVTIRSPISPAAEAYRKLRARVLTVGHGPAAVKTLLVTSASPGEGKTTIATNLAATLAQTGKRTILVSADFRSPGLNRLLKIRSAPGLSEVLSGEIPLGEALQPSGVRDLWVLASGHATPDDIKFLRFDSIERFLHAGDLVDYIVIDAAPLLAFAETLALAQLVDGVVIVAHARRSRRGAVIRVRQELEQVGARMLGVVVNEAPDALRPNYGRYGGLPQEPSRRKMKANRSDVAGREPDLVTAESAGPSPLPEDGGRGQEEDEVDGQDWLQRRETGS